MHRSCVSLMVALLFAFTIPAWAADAPPAKKKGGDKVMSGMSIVGNDEAPKSLVIVPWKSSELSDTLAVSQALDDRRGPVDREVFLRALDYHDAREALGRKD